MEQEYADEVHSIREWSPNTEIWNQIPESVEIGSLDACEEFLVLGSKNSPNLFWFNRRTSQLTTLSLEDHSSSCTVIKIASSVEYMVAVGTNKGQVNIFQIPKQVPIELQRIQNRRPPIQRFTVRDLHKTSVKCCAWSRNAMNLYSGDCGGVLVLTYLDYSSEMIRSHEILKESYEIVQISVNKSDVLVSTIHRTVICSKTNDQWIVKQVGTKQRKFLGPFGSEFNKNEIICARPGLRFWLADYFGTVMKTLIFKDAFQVKPCWDIPLLNPSRFPSETITNFGIPKIYNDYVLVWSPNSVYILSLNKLQIEASTNGFRNIADICIVDKEIFVLENSRSLIRLSPTPDIFSYPSSVMVFNNMILEEIGVDSSVTNAEEAIESESLKPIDISPDNIEQKLEAFDKIGSTDFESCILYSIKGGKHKPKKYELKNTGIVEIGCSAVEKVDNRDEVRLKDQIPNPNRKDESVVLEPIDECVEGIQSDLHIWSYLLDKENLEIQTTPRKKLHFIKETVEPLSPEFEIDLPKLTLELSEKQQKTSESNTSSEWEFLDN